MNRYLLYVEDEEKEESGKKSTDGVSKEHVVEKMPLIIAFHLNSTPTVKDEI